ncbi:MAG TPA: catalase [Thermoanaerobaculaceae bacterium]|nr:catalase [Thermoanaerobaculaceae bacterium]
MLPSTDWKETIPADEAERFERLAAAIHELQRTHARGGAPDRGLHAKGQAGLEAEFTVLPDVPEHARVGLFATPGTHRAYVRFSNGAGVRRADRKPDVRGLAIKVLGVPGKKLIPGLADATTQDFLLILNPNAGIANADEFVWLVLAAESEALLLPRAMARYGPLRGLAFVARLLRQLSTPVASLATNRYYSAVPSTFGPYAAHWALAPRTVAPPGADRGASPDYLAEELAARLEAGPVEYDFCVQFYRDESATPIEDASRGWTLEDAPPVPLARLTLPRQSMRSPRGRRVAEFVERLSFDPWHAPAEFRPLGNMMRLRRVAYRLSTKERGAAPEPDGSERFD